MKHYITISGDFDDSTLEKFISDFNSIPFIEEDLKIVIYLRSAGGSTYVSDIIIDIINNNPEYNISMIAVEDISSAAFILFYKVNVKEKRIIPFTIGMMHFSFLADVSLDEKGKPRENSDKAQLKSLKASKESTIKFCKSLGMNTSEIRNIESGKEVYFQWDRLQEFLIHSAKTS